MKNKYISKYIRNRFSKSTAKIKSVLFLFLGIAISANLNAQNSHTINTAGNTFSPSVLTITVGDTVTFNNTAGNHNINATQATFPTNPEGFGNGVAAAPWSFQWVFTIAGTYDYQCDPHAPGMSGIISVIPPSAITVTTSPASSVSANDGQATASVSGGVGPYFYYWENLSTGAGYTSGPTAAAVDISTYTASGTYEVTYSNSGIWSSPTPFTITAPGGSFTYSGSMGLCGLITTTNVTAYLTGCSFAGQTLGTQYILTDSILGTTLLNTTLFVDSVVLSNLGAGTYYLSALNLDNGCTANDTFTITAGVLTANVSSTNVMNTTSLGTATITIFGGTLPYSYTLLDASSTIVAFNNTGLFTGLPVGTYTYTVDGSFGCNVTGSIIIQNACSAQLSNPALTFCDSAIYLDAAMNMLDPGAYIFDYQLTDATNTIIEIQTATTATTTFTNPVTSSGLYYLTATEITTGCIATDLINVQITPITVTSVLVDTVTMFPPCNGEITITPNFSGAPYTFTWNTPGATSNPLSTNLDSLCEGSYCVNIVSSLTGCTYTECYDIVLIPCNITLEVTDSIDCFGFTGEITATIDTNNFGHGPDSTYLPGPRYSYQLYTINPLTLVGAPVLTNALSFSFASLLSDNYLVSVFDNSYLDYCSSDSLFLSEPNPLVIYTSVDSSSAPWIQDGVITIDSITGGNMPYNITWLDSVGIPLPTFGNLVQDSLGYSNQWNGGYTINVTDTNGCFETVTVYVHPIITFPYQDSLQNWIDTFSVVHPTCFGDCDGKLWAHIYDVGLYAVPPFTFKWYDLLTGALLKTDSCIYDSLSMSWACSPWYSPSHVGTYTNRCAGVYGLSVYDYYDNPVTDLEFVVADPDSMYVQLGPDFVIPCGEDTVLSSLVEGGTSLTNDTTLIAADILSFNNAPTGFGDTLITGKDYVLVVSGTYTDGFGLGNTFDAAYQFLPAPITPTIPMNWVMDGQTNHRPDPDVYDPINHTYYFPFVGNALPAIHNFYILNAGFAGNLTFEIREIVFDTNIYTYSWAPPFFPVPLSTADTALAYPGADTSGTDYILTVLDANGCVAKDTVNVSWDLYILNFDSIAITNVICNGDPTGAISVMVDSSSGFTPYSYSVPDIVPDSISSTSLTLASLATTGLIVGNYVFHLQDSVGCLSSDTIVTITEPDSVYACGIDTALISVLVETFTMTFDAPYSHTTVSTQLGIEYTLVVSGTYTDSWTFSTPVDIKDAAYQFNVGPFPINEWGWNGSTATRPAPDVYDPTTHTYEYDFTGDGANQVLTYTDLIDTNYLNNGGSLIFDLYKIVCSATDTAYTCFGDSIGTATVYPEGGVPFIDSQGNPYYNVAWTDNSGAVWDTTATVSGLPAGNYTATITDSLDCAYERSLVVLQPATALTIAPVVQTNVLCKGDSTGIISAVVSGGFGSQYVVVMQGNDTIYSLSGINGISDTIVIDSLAIGTYEFYIYDTIPDGLYGIYGCVENVQITITEPQDYLSSTINLLTDVSCWGDSTGAAVANVIGGQFPYTYAWDNGETNSIATGLWAGWQAITFTDDNGCTLRDSIEIKHLHPQITGVVTVLQNNSCFNVCDGIATLSTFGGVLPHTYWWDTQPAPTPANMPDTVSFLCAGGHDILVEDGVGCSQTITFTLTEPDELFAQAIGNGSQIPGGGGYTQPIQCYGFNDGTAFGLATGGTPTYAFVWDSINGQAGQNAIALTPGIHILYVTDANGCTASDTVVITEPDLLEVEIIDTMTVYSYCEPTNSGQLCAIATGGTLNYTYVWNDILGQTTPCAINLIARPNPYTVIVMDARNCIASVSFNLDSIAETMITDSVDMTIVDATCFGAYDGSVTINSVGGAVAPFTYTWTPAVGTTNAITSLYAGSYAVVIEDDNGCKLTVNAEVGEPDRIEYTIYNVIDETCSPLCDGQIWANVEGGTGNYYYDNSELGIFPIPGANQVQIVNDSLILNLCAGLHSIYITDDNNCEGEVVWGGVWQEIVDPGVVVIVPVVDVTNNTTSCPNSNDGAANLVPLPAGSPVFTYTWEMFPLSIPTTIVDTGDSALSLFSGSYILVAHYTDSASFGQPYSACDASSAVFTISAATAITFDLTPDSVDCYNTSTGSILVSNIAGGAGNYLYAWDTTTSISLASPPLNPLNPIDLLAGTYAISITDGNGCKITDSITVEQPDPITASISFIEPLCNDSADGSATITINGGTTPYISTTWTDSADVTVGTDTTVLGLSAGIYTCIVLDAHNCTDTFSVTVTEPSKLIAAVEANSFFGSDASGVPYNVSCNGSSNGTAIVTNGGGVEPITYSWDDPSGQTTNPATNLEAGVYTVTVTDSNNCTESNNVTIIEPSALVANGVQSASLSLFPGLFDVSCYGSSDGWIELYPSGGVPSNGNVYYYSWTATSSTYTATSSSIYNLIADTFHVTITDANGCEYDTSHVLTQPADPFVANVTTTNYAGPVHGDASISFIDATTTSTNDLLNHYWYWGDSNDPETFSNNIAGMTFAHTFTEIGDNNIYVLVQNAWSGCIDSVDFIIKLQGIPEISNVFSPNGDGVNDTISIGFGLNDPDRFGDYGMDNAEVDIYNRWGQLVVSWTGLNKVWDGTGDTNGQPLPEGVYFFVLKAEGEDGYYYEEKGSITLLR